MKYKVVCTYVIGGKRVEYEADTETLKRLLDAAESKDLVIHSIQVISCAT